MERCETCRHWKSIDGGEFDQPEMRDDSGHVIYTDDYETTPAPGRWGWCKKVAEFGPHAGSDRFYVIDGSEYSASLSTRSDFGCVEHEATDS